MNKILTKENYPNMIKAAKDVGACDEAMSIIETLSFEEFLEHEEIIHWLFWYAESVLNDRFKEAEPVIAKDACYAYIYARYVIGGRFKEAEPVIAKDIYYAYIYAKDIIKDRFKKAEPIIAQGDFWCEKYEEHFRIKICK